MGFIGLCGVLQVGETSTGPAWLDWWSGGMAVLAFLSSLVSTWMVGGVAFPMYSASAEMPANAEGRLKGGIRMTFVSIAMMVLAGAAGWWPEGADGGKVEVKNSQGDSACGTWVSGAPAGFLWLETSQGLVKVSIEAVTEMKPVSSC